MDRIRLASPRLGLRPGSNAPVRAALTDAFVPSSPIVAKVERPLRVEGGTTEVDERFRPIAQCMQHEGLPPLVVRTFQSYWSQLVEGATGLIGEGDIAPVPSLPDAQQLGQYSKAGREALGRALVIKLNGGLGTGMGLDAAKSLLPVKDGLTFLDVIARQTLAERNRSRVGLPLLLMNSFATDSDCAAALQRYPDLAADMPLSFLQHKVPKIQQSNFDMVPASYGEHAWCPPGHGDLYAALQTSGLLDRLLDRGYEYAFVSNSDNLGATLDHSILGYVASKQLPFLMEVADRTPADSKGGHLATRPDGRLMLREVAQCPKCDLDSFADIERHRYFNTNNIWIHLPSLKAALDAHDGVLPLPLIRNAKTADPRDPQSPAVFQLETAMGAAIELFDGAAAVRVPRSRFAPVKQCSDLLVLWSDAYRLTDSHQVIANPDNRYGLPLVGLDPKHYKFVDQLRQRFPHGAPSLKNCHKLTVEGDCHFGKDVEVQGDVKIINRAAEPLRIADGSVLTEDMVCS